MNIVLDLLMVFIIVLLIIGGYKRGFIKTVIELGGALLSSLIASVCGSLLAVNLYDSFIKDKVIEAVGASMPDVTPMTKTSEISESIFNNAPSYITNAFYDSGVNLDINSLTNQINDTVADVPALVESMIRPVILKIFTVVVTLVLFLVVAAIVAIISKKLTSLVNVTGLGGANRFLGGLVGLVEAIVLIMVLSLVLYFLTIMLPTDAARGLKDAIDSTYIYKLIYYIDLPDMIITKIIAV